MSEAVLTKPVSSKKSSSATRAALKTTTKRLAPPVIAEPKTAAAKSQRKVSVVVSKSKEALREDAVGLGEIKAGDFLPESIEMLDYQSRPLTWRDIPAFEARHGRTTADVQYDLALLSTHAVILKAPTAQVLPFTIELLLRMYDRSPCSCSWTRADVRVMFDMVYGEDLRAFDQEYVDQARLSLSRRYALFLGRAATAGYRWMEDDGCVTRRISNILNKIAEAEHRGEGAKIFLEYVSGKAWMLRNFDIDLHFPMPDHEVISRQQGGQGRPVTRKNRLPAQRPVYKGGAFS